MLFCVGESGGSIAGGIVLTPYSGSPKTAHVLNLGMWVVKEHRGNGMGSAMLEYVLEWARNEPGIRKVVLGVWNSNMGAVALYHKFGFRIEGNRRDVAKISGKYIDEILMGYDLEKKG